MKQPYDSSGRDLYFRVHCTCKEKEYIGTNLEGLIHTQVRLTGYADNNFFDNVHRGLHNGKCECGREFSYQWFRDGVEFKWKK